ncbi:MAG TPA: glycosyltransferase family 2 protein [Candidatus Saccharimonadia bacterium]|nr:glycosyltransferase family 2 protein [Candidatus Saccharimonadia bacterium]
MYKGKKIGVFVPAFNEENQLGSVLETLPDYIDIAIVVDDASKDRTAEVARKYIKHDKRIILHQNEVNQGNGAGAKYTYQRLVEMGMDIIVPVGGDGQTEPQYMPRLLDPVIEGRCDFAKGNRFIEPAAYNKMPAYRYWGNIFVTMINKFSTGYYSMYDSLNGYYAITASMLKKLNFDKLGDRYEFENSFWIQLNIANARGLDVSIPPVYKDEKSSIKLGRTAFRTLKVLLKGFVERIFHKYILFNFSPIGLFYLVGALLTLFGVVFGIIVGITSIGPATPSTATVMIAVVPFILGVQLWLQAIVLDIQAEPKALPEKTEL